MTQEELRSKLDEAFGRRKVLEDLLSHDGWKIIDGTVTARMQAFRQQFLTLRVKSLDAAFEAAGMQAIVEELQGVHSMPRIAMDELDGEIALLKAQIAEMEDARTEDE